MVSTEIRLILFFAAKDGEALYSQQKQDKELTVAQIMNSFRYNLNQIPNDYTVKVRNRFKGLDLIECLNNYERRFTRSSDQDHPEEKEMQKGKMIV